MTLSRSSTRAILTLSVGRIGFSGADFGDAFLSGWGSSLTPRGGGVPDRVYGTHNSGTLLDRQCWHGVSRLHRCFLFAHSAQANAILRFFFFPELSSVPAESFAVV
jgi:hypothetical protein